MPSWPADSRTSDLSGDSRGLPPTSPILNVKNPAAAGQRRELDLQRPLPPTPPIVTNYEIPTLRRKPNSDPPTSVTPSHSRSFSHPFPSFFGGKKTDKKSGSRQHENVLDMTDDESSIKDDMARPTSSSKHTSRNNSSKSDKQPVTGKCMTCDSTVRWPQGLKVFRCTICLTINDLEPYADLGNDGPVPGHHTTFRTPRRAMPLSLEKTRAIIDHCISDYLREQLAKNLPATPKPSPSVSQSSHLSKESSEGSLYDSAITEEPTVLSAHLQSKSRSPSESKLSPQHPIRNGRNTLVPGRAPDPSLQRGIFGSAPSGLESRLCSHDEPTEPRDGGRLAPMIFRELENYISVCFSGCAALNASFFTLHPQRGKPARTEVSDQAERSKLKLICPSPSTEDTILSAVDAKTLLLGDVAENGSWWTGNRMENTQSGSKNQRDRSPESWKGLVTAKTPRINRPELAEWYQLILRAGDRWQEKWSELLQSEEIEKDNQLKADSLLTLVDDMKQDFEKSLIHLHRSLLKSTENLLKRPRRPLKHPEDCRFLLMLLANPLLHTDLQMGRQILKDGQNNITSAKYQHRTSTEHSPVSLKKALVDKPSSKVVGPGQHSGIVKRILGLISNVSNEIHQCLVSWFSKFSDDNFQRLVDLTGSFVTYRLSRQPSQKLSESVNPTAGLVPSFPENGPQHASQLHAALGIRASSSKTKGDTGKPSLAIYGEDWQVRAAARVMALLFAANTGHMSRKRDILSPSDQRSQSIGLNARHQAHLHGQIIPISHFYNTMLDYADLVTDFEAWEATKSKFSFCQYPFFLSIWAKIHILEYDARRQMEIIAREAFFDSILSRRAISQYLVFKVRRDCLVEDSLRNVSEVVGSSGSDIKKGLRIDFVGEEGIDAGGLRKEWFLLLVREIFDPLHDLFVYDDESHFCYFNPACFESSEQFFLVGVLLGLAIYNSTILDVAFPPFVFKKMLASAPTSSALNTSMPRPTYGYTLDDLAELRPALARGLRQLLEYEGDVQETFCRDFVAEVDRYGELVQVPLCTGGERIPVTNKNRCEYVDYLIHYLLDTAVARQYEPFKRGFFTVCGGNALSLFRPEEIELLVRGSDETLDVASLRAVATYDGWPDGGLPPSEQPQVIWFWEFFERASPADQRRILSFVTGSDRIPAMGATNLSIRIQLLDRPKRGPLIDSDRFPSARTCYNALSLYAYSSREKLEHKLWTAVTGSEGFGLK